MATEKGVDFTFSGSLAAGDRIVVVEDTLAFESRYGTDVNVAGQWTGGLDNNGELLTLRDSTGADIERFEYDSKQQLAGTRRRARRNARTRSSTDL